MICLKTYFFTIVENLVFFLRFFGYHCLQDWSFWPFCWSQICLLIWGFSCTEGVHLFLWVLVKNPCCLSCLWEICEGILLMFMLHFWCFFWIVFWFGGRKWLYLLRGFSYLKFCLVLKQLLVGFWGFEFCNWIWKSV